MKVIKPSYIIETELNGEEILRNIELVARNCYKSEDKITKESAKKLIKFLIKRGHTSMIEHESITVRFIVNRGISHEIVRHRIASFAQESTRYVNYGKKNEITTINIATGFNYDLNNENDMQKYLVWGDAMTSAEASYMKMLKLGASPQEARSVLPTSTKTEVIMTANLRSWRNFFELRTPKEAHPQIREVAIPLLKELQEKIPVIFDDIEV